jgi:hypothetical protein
MLTGEAMKMKTRMKIPRRRQKTSRRSPFQR